MIVKAYLHGPHFAVNVLVLFCQKLDKLSCVDIRVSALLNVAIMSVSDSN